MIQLNRATHVIILDSKSLNSEYVVRELELKAFCCFTNEAFWTDDNTSSVIFLVGHVTFIQRNLCVLLNIHLVGTVCLIALPRPVEVDGSMVVKAEHLNDFITLLDLLNSQLLNLKVHGTE